MNDYSNRRIRKLNYIIHNPNMAEETAKALLKKETQVEVAEII